MSKKVISVALILSVICLTESCVNYNRIMSSSIKKSIGEDLKGYQIFSYPTDNFGLITSYENSVSDENFLCDMWNCIGVKDTNSDSSDWLSLNGYAGVGSGGTIELSEKKKTKVAVNVILPKIYDVVGISGGFKKDKNTTINISIGKAYLRKLRRDEILKHINSLDNTNSVKNAYINGNLVIVVADCVIEDMSVIVKVDQTTIADLDGKLGITGANVASRIFQDASLSVNVEKTSEGTYSFKVSHPVIFARLVKKQPGGGTLSVSDDFSDWASVVTNLDKSGLKNR